MYQDSALKTHLESSSSIQSNAAVIAEWNLNITENIARIGNYKYRPTSSITYLTNTYDSADADDLYTNMTYSDVVVDGGLSDSDVPISFISKQEKERFLYSLEDCFNRFRPRSGINKLRYFDFNFSHFTNDSLAKRPRYYIATKTDKFKYWTSYRKEATSGTQTERGISYKKSAGQYYIDDAVPFIVYKESVPANRVVVKMQTNVGEVDLGPFANTYSSFDDPFYGNENKTVPSNWKIQYLNSSNNWVDMKTITSADVINPDGYLELFYGITNIPSTYKNSFKLLGEVGSVSALPVNSNIGDAYLIKTSSTDKGTVRIWSGTEYINITPTYGWDIYDENSITTNGTTFALVNSPSYVENSQTIYREIQYIKGLRLVVTRMNKNESTFDLIELSPRLNVDISDIVDNLSVTKTASDIGVSGMPVGQLIAGTGSMTLFDYEDAFNKNNPNSIINNKTINKFQIKIYDVITTPDNKKHYVPIKSLYVDEPITQDRNTRSVSATLKDLLFYFDSTTAPQLLMENVSSTTAISLLLDSIGFSNYIFKNVEGESDIIIPHFFVGPDKSVAEVLQDIAVSIQSAMFFDENNNFIIMSKNYIMPSLTERNTDFVLYGTSKQSDDGINENKQSSGPLENIISISSTTNSIFNDGVIRYNTRYIQRSYGSIKQANVLDDEKTWVYKPALLWEVSGSAATKSKNDESGTQSSYALTAIPLKSDLPAIIPSVSSNAIIDNTMDLGEAIQWIARYNGYFFANGEIIKYDAVEYNVSGIGNVWINSVKDYQYYFSKVPFNGKMYATGLVRIFAEPNYQIVEGQTFLKNGPVMKHGRGQFGTPVVDHKAGLNSYWSDNNNVRGTVMKSDLLFSKQPETIISNVYSETDSRGTATFEVNNKIQGTATVTGNTKFTFTNHGLSNGNVIIFSSVPSGSSVTTTDIYYVQLYSDPLTAGYKDIFQIKTIDNTLITNATNGSYVFSVQGENAKQFSFYASHTPTMVLSSKSTVDLDVGDIIYPSPYSYYFYISGFIFNKKYYIKEKLTDKTFTISSTLGGAAIKGSYRNSGTISDASTSPNPNGYYSAILTSDGGYGQLFGANLEILTAVSGTGSFPTSKVFSGTPPTGSSVGLLSILPFTNGTVTDISVDTTSNNPFPVAETESVNFYTASRSSRVTVDSHRLSVNKTINFTTDGILPSPLIKSTTYYVRQIIDHNTFTISTTNDDSGLIKLYGNSAGIHTLKTYDLKENTDKQLIVPDASGIRIGQYINLYSGTGKIRELTKVSSITLSFYTEDPDVITLNKKVDELLLKSYIDPETNLPIINEILITDKTNIIEKDGISPRGYDSSYTNLAKQSTRTGLIKNFLSSAYTDEKEPTYLKPGTVQSSAFVFQGPQFDLTIDSKSFLSYVYKKMDSSYKHFGTRMRMIGSVNVANKNSTDPKQYPIGSTDYYTFLDNTDKTITVGGGSGGIAIMVNPETNSGYYLEMITLTESNVGQYKNSSSINNIIFYKLNKESAPGITNSSSAIPTKLWGATYPFLCDDGLFTGQGRNFAEQNPTVYDIAVEYIDIGQTRRFFIYLNNKLVGTVDDENPLPKYNNMALFVRGSSKAMFENVYAMVDDYSQNTSNTMFANSKDKNVVPSVFGDDDITTNESFTKYAMSGIIKSKYLSGIGPTGSPTHKLYFDEFGTIMREAAYFNVKYDKAYPALYAKLSPTFNNIRGYTVSGFIAGSYGAEFLVFNNTDTVLSLDETTGNYLRIQGVTFTQQSQNDFTVDEYFTNISDFSEIQPGDQQTLSGVGGAKQTFQDIKNSRATYGKKEFTLQSTYIQNQDSANNIMEWMISKITKPRKSVAVEIFASPILQLGDIVTIDYKNDNINQIADSSTRFVVYSIQYDRGLNGPTMTVYLSEVG
jgi:hypothetical protein